MKKNGSQSIKARPEGEEGVQEKHHTRMPLTSAERILALLFGFGFILGFLLTPLGVETRMPELRILAFAWFFITVVVNSISRTGFFMATKTETRRRISCNRRYTPFPHRTSRSGTVLLHGFPATSRFHR